MAKKKDVVGRARRKPAPVKKPFPVGFAIGSVLLVLALGAMVAYAAMNQGLGDKSSLRYAQSQIDGLETSKNLSQDHKAGPQSYPDVESQPPVGGAHNSVPQSCQVYDKAVANEHAVHSLEHGAVWVTYQPNLAKSDVDKLKKLVDGDPYRLLSPYPGLKSKVSLQAWGQQVFVDSASDKRVETFLDLFTTGPQTLERGAVCQGTTETGPVAPAPAPAPSASASPTTPATTPTPSASPKK